MESNIVTLSIHGASEETAGVVERTEDTNVNPKYIQDYQNKKTKPSLKRKKKVNTTVLVSDYSSDQDAGPIGKAQVPKVVPKVVPTVPDGSTEENLSNDDSQEIITEERFDRMMDEAGDAVSKECDLNLSKISRVFRPAEFGSFRQKLDDISLTHYGKVRQSIEKVLPIEERICDQVKSLTYHNILKYPVNFEYYLGKFWKINQSNQNTDPKKKAQVMVRVQLIVVALRLLSLTYSNLCAIPKS